MVIQNSQIRGSEHSGAEVVEERAAVTASAVIGSGLAAGYKLVGALLKPKDKMNGPEVEDQYATQNPLYKFLYEAYTERGVSDELAHRATVSRISGQDASNSTDIEQADRIASEWAEQESSASSQTATEDKTRQPSQRPVESLAENAIEATELAKAAAMGTTTDDETVSEAASSRAYKDPADMSWSEAKRVAKEISNETGEKPTGRTKTAVHSFIRQHGPQPSVTQTSSTAESVQTSEKKVVETVEENIETSPEVEKPLHVSAPKLKVPAKKEPRETASLQRENGTQLTENIASGYEGNSVPEKIAQTASRDFVEGKDASTSPAIAQANQQASVPPVIQREPLHQMFYDALTKSHVDPGLADKAALDMAQGKGALSSDHIKAAQNQALDRDLAKAKLPDPHKNWLKASRYNLVTDLKKRDGLIAIKGLKQGLNRKEVTKMLQLSPVAQDIAQRQGSTAAYQYIDKVNTKAFATFKQQGANMIKPLAAKVPGKKKGMEV